MFTPNAIQGNVAVTGGDDVVEKMPTETIVSEPEPAALVIDEVLGTTRIGTESVVKEVATQEPDKWDVILSRGHCDVNR